MKNLVLILLLVSTPFSIGAKEATSHTFSGYLDGNDFVKGGKPKTVWLRTALNIDTSLIKKAVWENLVSNQVEVNGYFYIDSEGNTKLKIKEIESTYEDNEEEEVEGESEGD
jgi:hypothetical protein